MNALFPNPNDPGEVTILVWETIDYADAMARIDRCLVLKRYAKPQDGNGVALGYFLRRWEEPQTSEPWKVWMIYNVTPKPGEPDVSEAVKCYKVLPADDEVAAFLKHFAWSLLSTPGELRRSIGRAAKPGQDPRPVMVKYTPTLLAGGVCHRSWQKVFGREGPLKLFPELQTPSNEKKP